VRWTCNKCAAHLRKLNLGHSVEVFSIWFFAVQLKRKRKRKSRQLKI
jgi:hypothetical protein